MNHLHRLLHAVAAALLGTAVGCSSANVGMAGHGSEDTQKSKKSSKTKDRQHSSDHAAPANSKLISSEEELPADEKTAEVSKSGGGVVLPENVSGAFLTCINFNDAVTASNMISCNAEIAEGAVEFEEIESIKIKNPSQEEKKLDGVGLTFAGSGMSFATPFEVFSDATIEVVANVRIIVLEPYSVSVSKVKMRNKKPGNQRSAGMPSNPGQGNQGENGPPDDMDD
jgi:hypothetical protein